MNGGDRVRRFNLEKLSDELEEIGLSAKKLADVIQVPLNRLTKF
jgi:hypothetical protein